MCLPIRPKMIVLPPIKICPKTIVWLICPTRNLRFKVKHFHAKLSSSRSLSTLQLRGHFVVVIDLYFKKESFLQLLGQWSAGLNVAKVRNTDNHFKMEAVSSIKIVVPVKCWKCGIPVRYMALCVVTKWVASDGVFQTLDNCQNNYS